MLIGARDGCVFGGDTIEEKMQILSGFGYDFLELTVTPQDIPSYTEEAVEKYRGIISRTGLPILSTSFGKFGGFASMEVEQRKDTVAAVSRLINFTKSIGGDAILLATYENKSVPECAALYRQELAGVMDQALQFGITLCLEHVAKYKPYNLAKLVQAVDHSAVRMYFDMGNCLYVGESPLEQARICASLTAQLHIKGGPVVPLGAMPLVEVREILEAAGFQGRGCLEISKSEGERGLWEARGLLKMAGYWS